MQRPVPACTATAARLPGMVMLRLQPQEEPLVVRTIAIDPEGEARHQPEMGIPYQAYRWAFWHTFASMCR